MFSPSPSASRAAAQPSLVTHDTVITGTLVSEGDIQIDGRVEGDVHCARLIIGESGSVHGDILAATVTVRGRSEGSVRAGLLSLAATARMKGDILHRSLTVEAGAIIQGRFRHASDPLAAPLPAAAEARGGESHAPAKAGPLRAAG